MKCKECGSKLCQTTYTRVSHNNRMYVAALRCENCNFEISVENTDKASLNGMLIEAWNEYKTET